MHRENRIGKGLRGPLSLALLACLPLLLVGCTDPAAMQQAMAQQMPGAQNAPVAGQPAVPGATPTAQAALNGNQPFSPFGSNPAGGLGPSGKGGLAPPTKQPPMLPPFKLPPFQLPPFNFGGFGDGPSCFVAGTLVLTAGGLIPIERITTGMQVIAPLREAAATVASVSDDLPFFAAAEASRPVVRTTKLSSKHLRTLKFRGSDGQVSQLETTDGHPFWVEGRGWIPAGKLTPGQIFSRAGGGYATLESTVRTERPEGVWVYNLEVEGSHTYRVAGLGVLVQSW